MTARDTLYTRFLAVAARRPHAVAVTAAGRDLTYAELARRGSDVRDEIRRAGVPPGSPVGMSVGRTANLAVATLGILGHDCAYVPIDPRYPAARRRYIADDAELGALVVEDAATGALAVIRRRPRRQCDLPAGTAYVIYTSGSTGKPKGTLVGHRHVLGLFDACDARFDLTDADTWTLFHSYSFDFSVWELWGALLHGARVVVVGAQEAANPWRLLRMLSTANVSVLSQVPTAFGYLVAALEDTAVPLPALRYVVLGGEAVNLPVVERWHEIAVAMNSMVVNMYGITETTVHVTFCPLSGEPYAPPRPGASPIGVPLPHLGVRLVDERLRDVPPGTPGEMLVTGDGVTFGYLGRPDLTAERFISLPDEDGRAYRSGDWAVRDTGGNLHYLGRQDRQVKVHGHRIELAEPEAAIAAHPDVLQCAVTTYGADEDRVLVAHYVLRRGRQLDPEALDRYLKEQLPAPLRPTRLWELPRLPLTVSGKVDRAALADAAEAATAGRGVEDFLA